MRTQADAIGLTAAKHLGFWGFVLTPLNIGGQENGAGEGIIINLYE